MERSGNLQPANLLQCCGDGSKTIATAVGEIATSCTRTGKDYQRIDTIQKLKKKGNYLRMCFDSFQKIEDFGYRVVAEVDRSTFLSAEDVSVNFWPTNLFSLLKK